jgi:phage terminase small subunit
MSILKNPKHEIFAQEVALGKSAQDAAKAAGYSDTTSVTQSTRLSKKVEIQSRIVELHAETARRSTWNAAKVLQRLGEQADADIRDLQSEDGKFKPLAEWPLVWRRMIQGLEIEQKSVRSSDGVQAGESKAWDKTQDRIIKIKFVDRLKNLELLGRHKAIDAFVAQKIEGKLEIEVTVQQVAQRLQAGRERLLAARTIEVVPSHNRTN